MSITYDGVAGAEGGNIFQDTKFWVSHRVPTRSTILKKIRENGGQLVLREKDADMLLADHAKKFDVPAGSYSWKFVEDSVKNGCLQLKDRYMIGRDPDAPRPIASGGGTKRLRSEFDAAQDAAIAKWALEHPVDRTGNKIWQEYEKIDPRHTWQSWRNRYVKKLHVLDIKVLEKMAATAPERDDQSRQREPSPAAPAASPRRKPETGLKPTPRDAAPAVVRSARQTTSSQRPVASPVKEPKRRPEIREVVKRGVPRRPTMPNHQDRAAVTKPPSTIKESIEQHAQPEPSSEIGSRISESDASGSVRDKKDTFYDDLDMFIQECGIDVGREHTINGISFGAFDLATAVKDQEVPDDEVNWIHVATELGFRVRTQPTLNRIRDCYEAGLDRFLATMDKVEGSNRSVGEADELGVEEEEEVGEEALGEEEHEGQDEREEEEEDLEEFEEFDPKVEEEEDRHIGERHSREPQPKARRPAPEPSKSPQVPSSPPARFGGKKRQLSNHFPSSSRTAKRPRSRYDRNAEIPSTPEEKIFINRPNLLRQEYVDESEASQQLPPLPDADMDEDEEEEEEVEDEPLPRTPEADITLSQPLHHETIDATPIPIHLRHDKRPAPATALVKQVPRKSNRFAPTQPPRRPPATASKPTRSQPPRRSLPSSFTTSASQPPRKTTGSLPPRQSSSNRQEIHEWITHYESLGFPHAIVIEGLKRTTMTPGRLATTVMAELQKGNAVPSHHEGIWTDRDDEDLLLINNPRRGMEKKVKRASDRLENKHGAARMELRKAFLEARGESAGRSGG